MTVRELIARLQDEDPEAEVHYPLDHGTVEADELDRSTATYGIATPNPRTVKTVVLITGWEHL